MIKLSLVAQAANSIEEKIEEGYWEDTLPGSRTIADILSVSRNTAIAAISILEERGVVLPATKKGKPRSIRIKNPSSKISKKTRNLLFLYHQRHQLDQVDESILLEIKAMWSRSEGKVFLVAVDYQKFNSCEAKLLEITKRFSTDALVLLNPTRSWALQAHSMFPTFLLGGDVPRGWEGNLIAYSIYQTLQNTLKMLKEGRHKRVLIPSCSLGNGFQNAAVKAFENVYGEKLPHLTVEDYCPRFVEATADCWQEYWAKSFLKIKPTAVILPEAKYVCSLYSHCLHYGIKIPEDLIVVVLDNSDFLEWFSPAPLMHRFPVDQALDHFRKWMANDLNLIGYKTPALDALF